MSKIITTPFELPKTRTRKADLLEMCTAGVTPKLRTRACKKCEYYLSCSYCGRRMCGLVGKPRFSSYFYCEDDFIKELEDIGIHAENLIDMICKWCSDCEDPEW